MKRSSRMRQLSPSPISPRGGCGEKSQPLSPDRRLGWHGSFSVEILKPLCRLHIACFVPAIKYLQLQMFFKPSSGRRGSNQPLDLSISGDFWGSMKVISEIYYSWLETAGPDCGDIPLTCRKSSESYFLGGRTRTREFAG